MSLFAIASLAAFTSACTPDLLVDNFPSIKQEQCIPCGREPDNTYPTRFFNLIEGDYGAKDAVITVSPSTSSSGGTMRIVSEWGASLTHYSSH